MKNGSWLLALVLEKEEAVVGPWQTVQEIGAAWEWKSSVHRKSSFSAINKTTFWNIVIF